MPPRKSGGRLRVADRQEPVDPIPKVEKSISDPGDVNEDDGLAEIAAANTLGRLRQEDLNRGQSGIPQLNLHNTLPRIGWTALREHHNFQEDRLINVPTIDWASIDGCLQQAGNQQHNEYQVRTADFDAAVTTHPVPKPHNTTLPQPIHPTFLQPADRGYGGSKHPFSPPDNVFNANRYYVLLNQIPHSAQAPNTTHAAANTYNTRLPTLFPNQSDLATTNATHYNIPTNQDRSVVQPAPTTGYGVPTPDAYNAGLPPQTPTQADTNAALAAYSQKYLQNLQPYQGEEDLIMCICLRPDDGLPYIECNNQDNCMKRWYHLNCLGFTAQTAPGPGVPWYCPDCQRQQIGGAAKYQRLLAQNARMVGRPRQVWQQFGTQQNPTTGPGDDHASGTFQNFHVWNFKTAADDHRALVQPFGDPNRFQPVGVGGTVLKKPNKNSWLPFEEEALEACVKEAADQGLSGQPLWEAVLPKLRAMGVSRCMGAARNRYMRGLREKTGIDERRKPNPKKLTTSKQVAEKDRDPNSCRKKGRYAVSRAWGAPAETPPPMRVETPVAPRRRRAGASVRS